MATEAILNRERLMFYNRPTNNEEETREKYEIYIKERKKDTIIKRI